MRREDSPKRTERDVTKPRLQPGQAWVCGYAELGQSCRSGPTCTGQCGRTLKAEHDAGNVQGVDDEDRAANDLPPCIPRRSLASRRQAMRMNLAILTGGLLMLCLVLPSREKTFVPGELSAKHAQILENTVVSQRCGLCHPTSHSGNEVNANDSTQWALLSSAKRLIENDGRQDQLCMQCHREHLPAAGNRDPHDLSPSQWRELEKVGQTPWQLVSTRKAIDGEATESATSLADTGIKTSCASCHNEHHGRGFDIKLIGDSRCQACHQKQFESLASGHPEFKNYPVDRPRGLAFSHGKHAKEHFAKKNRDFDCSACHVTRSDGASTDSIMRTLSFDESCASCHEQPIRAATVDGWAAIQLPSLESKDTSIVAELSKWPLEARYGYDGVVSPLMRALLMADPQAAAALNKIPASGKIVDISTISATREQVAKTIAIATAKLISDTARDGQAAWTARLETVTKQTLQRELSDRDKSLIAKMTAGLPPDLFRNVESQWLSGQQPLAQRSAVPAKVVGSRKSEPPAKSTGHDDDLLTEPSKDDLLSNEPAHDSDLLLGGGDAASTPSVAKPARKLVKGVTHLASGGWYADETTLAIRYMPTGHADPTLAAWTLWWSMIEANKPIVPTISAERIARGLSQASDNVATELMAHQVPGNCAECHQLNHGITKLTSTSISNSTSTSNGFSVSQAFQVPERNAKAREFTKFQHTPHLTLPTLKDCRYCHKEKSDAEPSAHYHPVASEFSAMNIAQCAACHRTGGANDRCTQCHNYHVLWSAKASP